MYEETGHINEHNIKSNDINVWSCAGQPVFGSNTAVVLYICKALFVVKNWWRRACHLKDNST